ncbi:MAG: hypothetical protein WC917_03015 [Bacilli bacterium]|jgi:hypothetical protein
MSYIIFEDKEIKMLEEAFKHIDSSKIYSMRFMDETLYINDEYYVDYFISNNKIICNWVER